MKIYFLKSNVVFCLVIFSCVLVCKYIYYYVMYIFDYVNYILYIEIWNFKVVLNKFWINKWNKNIKNIFVFLIKLGNSVLDNKIFFI